MNKNTKELEIEQFYGKFIAKAIKEYKKRNKIIANNFKKTLFIQWLFKQTRQQVIDRVDTIRRYLVKINLEETRQIRRNNFPHYLNKEEYQQVEYKQLEDIHIYDFELINLFNKQFYADEYHPQYSPRV